MSEKKKVEEKKTPNVLITIIGIAVIFLMLIVGWYAGGRFAETEDKFVNGKIEEKESKKEKEVEKEIELVALRDDLSDKVALMESIHVFDSKHNGYAVIYSKDIKSSDISDDEKLFSILDDLENEYYNNGVTTDYDFGISTLDQFTLTQLDVKMVENEYKKLYGNDEIKHKSLEGNLYCPGMIYDSKNNKYYSGVGACGYGGFPESPFTYINRMTTKGNNAYVYVNFGVYDTSNNNIYTDYEKTKLYKTENDVELENYITKDNYEDFSEYKYTFVKEDGNYIFKSVERVK